MKRGRGFAAMDPEMHRAVSRLGGLKKREGPRGFAALSPEQRQEIAARGGAASTGHKGFAVMNPEKHRRIASAGGLAPHTKPRGMAALSPERRAEVGRKIAEGLRARRERIEAHRRVLERL